ncbi:MAG: RidA family protein [Pseudomonadota bacterium]
MRAALATIAALFALAALIFTPVAHAQDDGTGRPAFLPLKGSATPYSEAVQVGDVLYLAGKLGTAADGSGLVPGGIKAETQRAMESIGETLAKYDLTHDAVFKCTVFLADINDFAEFNAVYRTFFKEGRYPARSTVAVKGLALGAAIEVECIAHNPQE